MSRASSQRFCNTLTMKFKAHALGKALMSKKKFSKPRRQHESNSLGLDMMSKGEIAQDLNTIDSVLAFMLPALELRDVTVGTVVFDHVAHFSTFAKEFRETFDSLAHPSMFLQDFRAMIKAHVAVPIGDVNDEARAEIVEAFKVAQFHAQVFVGERVLLPFAGDYAYTGSDFPRSNGMAMFKPNAIKRDDLKLCITWLVEKIRVYTEQRLEIARMSHLWRISISENNDTRMSAEFARTSTFLSSRIYQIKQSDLDARLLVSELKRKKMQADFEESERRHHRETEEKMRTVWLLIDKCSSRMQQELQTNSVETVRLIWKTQLDSPMVSCI